MRRVAAYSMKLTKILIYIFSLLIPVILSADITHSNGTDDEIIEIKKKEVEEITRQLIENLLSGNIEGILNAVDASLQCGDGSYDYREIEQDLLNSNSALYIRLFDTKNYQKKHPNAISLAEYFKNNKNKKITVVIPQEATHLADVYFTHYIQFYFLYKDNKWVLIEGLYDCP